jgi:hypothetical protein
MKGSTPNVLNDLNLCFSNNSNCHLLPSLSEEYYVEGILLFNVQNSSRRQIIIYCYHHIHHGPH